MAEFQEVMKQWVRARIAEGYGDDPLVTLPSCLLNEIDFERLENEVMQCAKEHPEPVYPTWAEYLNSIGVIISDRPFPASNIPVYVYQAGAKMFESIPTNIAQKLGITPKENY